AALLLKEKGYDVIGVTLRTWEADENGAESRCCEIDDAREIARTIGIPFYTFNCVSAFKEQVVAPFIEDYVHGRTPNPCVICNRCIKWERLLYHARVLGADRVATGHYARVLRLPDGRFTVKTASHAEKDQTYMLYRLSQEQLSKTLMPLGDLSKEEARRLAAEAGLSVAAKPDSQEICFVAEGHYSEFIEEHAGDRVPGKGAFVDEAGKVLGKHKGITRYTVGQRKGLGVALGKPAYVKEIRSDTNEVVLATEEEALLCPAVLCENVNWMSVPGLPPDQAIPCRVKIRYHHPAAPARLEASGDGVTVLFDAPVKAPAPGQSAVFYDEEDRVIGGGIIAKALY
ncbi:MAG: tRNA 2-thiouridine(34) synthase MnmA, partial [Clostridia bacterium]|nr:tRNA 2-thiouridine(34) synthase MnmA [Clostridia bacterium]